MMTGLYSGATGLISHSTGMSVVSNNLANVNTVAYKQTSLQYADVMGQYLPTSSSGSSGVSQVGAGSMPGSIRTLFSQGAFEDGGSVTDLAISGIGFFAVQQNGVTEYTRAGDFHFTASGALVDSSGWNLMGHAISNGVEEAAVTPISIDTSSAGIGVMASKSTSLIESFSQLGGVEDVLQNSASPFFAMASAWDGSAASSLSGYSYKEDIQFYDSGGTLRSASIYYDLAGSDGGQKVVEYVVAMDPAQDGSALAGTKAAGLLMAGTLTFSSSGELQSLTAFTPPESGDPADLAAWKAAPLQGGSPAFQVTPAGSSSQSIALGMGLTLSEGSSFANAAQAAASPAGIYAASATATRKADSSTAYGTTTGTKSLSMDGYGEGLLQDLSIASDGTITASYSNGQAQDLYRIPLYRFVSQDGLENSGGNHYKATAASGSAQEGVAGTENLGSISEYSLEASNVDYAREFSTMIITQRGFQMNSKVITTCDQMLQKALELKR